ncbi:hypothetical protein UFOVP611_41 [uncultured Caudovirales phage]|uniref:Uncharacterized protein n=1 Tax=uncultured Caudovirales phage TaxID=2100421 RepID=A0A6J5N2K7_9CAUD|nr:hypothetical protein UFOVP611_41 [uncultured Caudovirales phage]
METTTKQFFHYNNEALIRMARIFLTKYGYSFNQFYCVGTSSGTITLQGYIENNPKLLMYPAQHNVDGSTIQYNVNKYIRVVLSPRGY